MNTQFCVGISQSIIAPNRKLFASIRRTFPFFQGILERIYAQRNRRRKSANDEFATLAMQWAHSDKIEIEEKKFFYRKGKRVLLEKSEDGFVEMGSFNKAQRKIIVEEVERRNEILHNGRFDEGIRQSSLFYEDIGAGYLRDK